MMAGIRRHRAHPETVERFVLHKIKGFWPELFVSVILAIGIYRYCGASAVEVARQSYNTILSSLLLLKMTGVTPSLGDWNGPTWYLSSMVIGMSVAYLILRRYGTSAVSLILSVGLCGYLLAENGTLLGPYKWMGWTYAGNIRALAEILLGAFAWQGARWLTKRSLNVWMQMLLAMVKWLAIAFVFFISHVSWKAWDGACLVALWCVIVIAFSGQSAERVVFQNRICLFLGAFSLPLYLSHRVWTFRLGAIIDLSAMNRWEILLLLGAFSVVSALITMGGARALRYFWKRNISA